MTSDQRLALAVGLDSFAVTLFVALGRRTHDQGSAFAGVLETAAPFFIGLAVGWAVVRAWRSPTSVLTGLAIWPITVLVGMIARRWIFGDGTATAFVIVATAFLGAALVGWRAGLRVIEARRRRQSSGALSAR